MSWNARRNTSRWWSMTAGLMVVASGHSIRRGISCGVISRLNRPRPLRGGQSSIRTNFPLSANASRVSSRGFVAKNTMYLRLGKIAYCSVLLPDSVGPTRPTCWFWRQSNTYFMKTSKSTTGARSSGGDPRSRYATGLLLAGRVLPRAVRHPRHVRRPRHAVGHLAHQPLSHLHHLGHVVGVDAAHHLRQAGGHLLAAVVGLVGQERGGQVEERDPLPDAVLEHDRQEDRQGRGGQNGRPAPRTAHH